jgi:peptide chain release factor subunit 1
MQVTAPDRDELRRLAEMRLDRPIVLSLYLDLDPAEFATPPARATAVRSLLDEAERRLREHDALAHQDRADLQASLQQAAALLENDLPADGAQSVAVFSSNAASLFEVLALPRPVPSRVAIGRSPLVGPLARLERRERWCVALVSRRDARIFRGSPESLREVEQIHDVVFGQHDQGGWSQARYQRGIEKEKDDHLKNTAEALMKHFKRRPFQRLILGGPRDTATPEKVLQKTQPLFESIEEEREAAALERLGEGGRAALNLEQVLQALNERRVECLLLDERFSAPGTACPECGWLGPAEERTCPVDGRELEQLDDLTEAAIELTLQQSAEILAVRRRREELQQRAGGVAALLRF